MRNPLFALSVLTALAAGCNAQPPSTADAVTGASSTADAVNTPAATSIPSAPACDTQSLPFGGGNGSSDSPYLICTDKQLQNLGLSPYNGLHAKLMADIGAQTMTQIGSFSGSFDGNGHYVAGFKQTVKINGRTGCGLFDLITGSVTNLDLRNFTITCSGDSSGMLAAGIQTTGSVDNVTVHDGAVTGNQGSGALVGFVYGAATNVYSWLVTVTCPYSGGGLVGQIVTGGSVSGNSASGSYSAVTQSGFVVGILQGTLTCLPKAGHTWASVHSVGYLAGGGVSNGCP